MISRYQNIVLLLIIALLLHCQASWATSGRNNNNPIVQPVISGLQAEFRHGQVFITWREPANISTESFRIYISREPISKTSLNKSRLITSMVGPKTAADWYEDSTQSPRATGARRGWIIKPHSEPINPNGGLFVYTVRKADPSRVYFAVMGKNEQADLLVPGTNSLMQPVEISHGNPQPIWQLNEQESDSAIGKPLALYLHSHQSRPKGTLSYLFFGDSTMGWREGLPFKFKITLNEDLLLLEPYDRVWINRKMAAEEARPNNGLYDTQFKNIETWWYGTNSYIYDAQKMPWGQPVNYTERWVMKVLGWVQQQYKTDTNRVYAFGASMGSGVLRWVLQYGNKFASADLQVPILDPFGEGAIGRRMATRLGMPESICSDNVPLADRLNTLKTIRQSNDGITPIIIRAGRKDRSVFWTAKPGMMRLLQEKKYFLLMGWDNGSHMNAMRKNYEAFPGWFDFKWHIRHFALNKSYPVFTNASFDQNPGNGQESDGDLTGFVNRGLDWEVLADKHNEYRLIVKSLKTNVLLPVTVDITPRNLQQFKNFSSRKVEAHNIDAAGKVVQREKIKVVNGLVTFKNFRITSCEGNQLVLK